VGIIRKIVTVSMIFVLTLSILSILGAQVCPVSANPIPACLTGVIHDEGIDNDGSGYFEYLYVGVEVEVTDPGLYSVHLGGLRDAADYYISVWDSNFTYLDAGIRVVDLYLYGPAIYDSGKNPALVHYIELSKVEYFGASPYLGSLWNIPLSEEYSYTEFDAPFNDMEARFTVYPDGRVLLGGALNYTYPVPQYMGPEIQSVVGFTKSDDLALASANCTFIIPPDYRSQFPFDSSTLSLLAEYSGKYLDLGINSTVTLPAYLASEFPFNATDATIIATYSDGILEAQVDSSVILPSSLASQFPFNTTTFTAQGEYSENEVTGTVTVHILPGFALGDLNMDFEGNRTYLSVNGDVTIVYGTYQMGGQSFELNETSLDGWLEYLNSTIPGRGPGSLYNMTFGWGEFECTKLVTTKTPLDEYGARVDFDVDIHGDFVYAVAILFSGGPKWGLGPDATVYATLNATFNSVESVSFNVAYTSADKRASVRLSLVDDVRSLVNDVLPLYVRSPMMQPAITEPQAKLLNATFNSVENATFKLKYSRAEGKFELNLKTVDDAYGLWEDAVTILPEAVPEMKTLIEMFLARMFCSINSAKVSLTYEDAKADLKATVAINGDLNAELNYLKNSLINYLNETGIGPRPPPTKSFTLNMDEYAFNETNPTITVNRNDRVEILLINNDESEHNFVIDELDLWTDPILPGTSYGLVFDAYQAGNFTYYSSISDDRDRGMEGKFIVQEEPSPPLPPPPLPWQLLFLNETEIDISSLKLSFSVKETSVTGNLEGLAVLPPIDTINATSFKLERFFNLTTGLEPYEPPKQGEKLKVIIEGGSNTTHVVILSRPGTVPEPDITTPDQRSMVWYNQSVSDLKDLIFTVSLQGFIVKWNGEEYPVTTLSNSTITDFDFSQSDKEISLTVEGPPGTIGYCEITIPHELLGGPYFILVNGEPPRPEPDVTSNATHTSIYLTYHHSVVRISIFGTTVIQEFPSNVMPLFMIATLVAAALGRGIWSTKRKREFKKNP